MNPGIGKAIQRSPTSAHMNPTTLPAGDRGDISPYPTVVIVIIAHQSECGIDKNALSASFSSTNHSSEANKVPKTKNFNYNPSRQNKNALPVATI